MEPPGANPGPAPGTRPANLRGAHVLLVEDNIVNQTVARAMLLEAGCRVASVESGRQAVEAWGSTRFDLVLMDWQMADMDGCEATRRIRAMPSVHRVPIIALTASAMEGDRERCLAAGMDDYLAKPYTHADLCAVLQRWLASTAG